MTDLAIATTSVLASNAARDISELGGNAVDAAISAALISITTEPGVCSLGGGGFVTVWPPGVEPITIDGNIFAPGHGIDPKLAGRSGVSVYLEYGGGVETVVGPGSVGVPAGIAALGHASKKFGQLPWKELFQPAIAVARQGFPLPEASFTYLQCSGEPIFGRSRDGYTALHHADGALKQTGDQVRIPHLADTLERIAGNGPEEFYTGATGQAIVAHIQAGEGSLTGDDMQRCQAIERECLIVERDKWQVATNPPPAIGGTVLAAMLTLMQNNSRGEWNSDSLRTLIDVQRTVLGYRRDHLDLGERHQADADRLLKLAAANDNGFLLRSPSTVHTSATDSDGLICSLTMSAGYGSGEMPEGTGVWLNNCLGELELNKQGLGIGPPGIPIASNMAPTAARSASGETLAIGSPGADRITTAILQVLVNHLQMGMPLHEAIAWPRAHVELEDNGFRVAHEEGLDIKSLGLPTRNFSGRSMYFGGVGAASWSPKAGFDVAADPRRTGSTWCSLLS